MHLNRKVDILCICFWSSLGATLNKRALTCHNLCYKQQMFSQRFLAINFPQVWKLGWSPRVGGEFGTTLPEIPVEFLQEKEVFKEFIYRINVLGKWQGQRVERNRLHVNSYCLVSKLPTTGKLFKKVFFSWNMLISS